MYLYYEPWLNLISWFYYHNMPVEETNNLHPQMIERGRGRQGRRGEHKATRKAYQQHQTTRTGSTSSSGSLANAKLGSKGRFDDMQQCFLSACESQSHTIYRRERNRKVAQGRAVQSHRRSSSAYSEILTVIPHLLPSLKLFFCFPPQATAWLLWPSCSLTVW